MPTRGRLRFFESLTREAEDLRGGLLPFTSVLRVSADLFTKHTDGVDNKKQETKNKKNEKKKRKKVKHTLTQKTLNQIVTPHSKH